MAAVAADLNRRVKALACLSEVHAVIQRFDQPREELFRGIAGLIPPAMRHPELAHARIAADGRMFASPGFRAGRHVLAYPLALSGQPEAVLEVFYERRPDVSGEIFSPDEAELVRLVAQRLERTMARLRADEALRRERELSSLLMETLPGGVARLDRDGETVFCNPRAAAILELERRQPGVRIFDDPGFAAVAQDGQPLSSGQLPFARVMGGGRPVYDMALSIARPEEGRRFLSVSAAPLLDADGLVEQVVLSIVDVTDQRAMERQLAHALKLESLGQLAAGIAHEINTPVQYVGDNLEFLGNAFAQLLELFDRLAAMALEDDDPQALVAELITLVDDDGVRFLLEEAPAAIRESREGLDRVAEIVLSMKRFAHPGVESPQPVDVAQAIRDTLAVSRGAWKFTADVRCDVEPDLPPIRFVPGDFHQVLLNIVVNAAQAIEEKTTGQGGMGKGHIDIRAVRRGDAVEISIADDGPGIPEADQTRVFDPFFTTKEVGKGTGQGLTIVHSIMTRHQARLELFSAPGEGTRFVLTLPCIDQPGLEA